MSKRQSVILSVVLEGLSQAEAARRYGVSESSVSRWVARYRTDGDAAFEPRSRRPHTSPSRLAEVVITQIVNLRDELAERGLDAGPATIAWHLQHRHDIDVSVASIRRHLIASGRIAPEPRKRPRSSYIRFQADLPNEMWQTDMTHVGLANGDAEVLSWLDDHSRYALRVTAHDRVTARIVVAAFNQTAHQHGLPASVLSDNGLYYTARFARGGASGPNRFEQHLTTLGVDQKHSRPNHPTTCGKVERFQQTLKKWLAARPDAHDLAELQTRLDEFVHTYNNDRPHRAIAATPTVAYHRLPKTGPRGTEPDLRVRHDRVDKTGSVTLRRAGRLHHIGIGRTHAGTDITLLIADRDIRIIATHTGQLLRHLTLDPTRDYQPQNAKDPNP